MLWGHVGEKKTDQQKPTSDGVGGEAPALFFGLFKCDGPVFIFPVNFSVFVPKNVMEGIAAVCCGYVLINIRELEMSA